MNSTLQSFTAEDTWHGGHYGIEFELGAPSDDRVRVALQAIWSHPSLEGCYISRDVEPCKQVRVDLLENALEGHLYGIATLPNGGSAACGTYICRLQDQKGQPLRDLLSFYVPLGALSKTYPVGPYPFSDVDRAAAWRPELDRWMVNLGRRVFGEVRFPLALVGFEVDFPKVTAEAVQRDGVPAKRYDGFLQQVGDRLEWYPPTDFELIRVTGIGGIGSPDATPSSNPKT